MLKLKTSLITILLALLCGCGASRGRWQEAQPINSVRLAAPKFQVVERNVQRREFAKALQGADAARIIEIFKREGEGASVPEYRIFDVKPRSAYALLGLEDADVLVAASGYVITTANAFRRYLSVVGSEPGGELEIRRAGRPILIKFTFVE